MARPQPAPTMDSLSGFDAKMEALAKLELLQEEVDAALARKKSNGFLRRSIKAWRRGDITRAGQLALSSTGADETNAKAYHVLGMALERMGHVHKALVTYERAFELDPEDPELLINLGLIAWNLKQNDGAARMFSLYIDACPESPLGYNNLGSILCDMGQPESAIETLRAAIFRMPQGPRKRRCACGQKLLQGEEGGNRISRLGDIGGGRHGLDLCLRQPRPEHRLEGFAAPAQRQHRQVTDLGQVFGRHRPQHGRRPGRITGHPGKGSGVQGMHQHQFGIGRRGDSAAQQRDLNGRARRILGHHQHRLGRAARPQGGTVHEQRLAVRAQVRMQPRHRVHTRRFAGGDEGAARGAIVH